MNDFELYWKDRNTEFRTYIQATEKDISEKLNSLETYGKKGELPDNLSVDLLDDLCCTVLATEAVADVRGFDTAPLLRLKDALTVFFARLKLDIASGKELPPVLEYSDSLIELMSGVGSDFLTVHELSLLWEMHPNTIRGEVLSRKEVKSALQKKDKLLLVPVDLALALSLKRRNFDAGEEQETEGMMLVPVTVSGEFFSYQCRNKNGFRIGKKGEEHLVPDFDSALAELRSMQPKAYWRRKNRAGNWGIVAAIRWELRSIEAVTGLPLPQPDQAIADDKEMGEKANG